MNKKKVTIDIELGSHWQEELHMKSLELMLIAWRANMESKHQNNHAMWEIDDYKGRLK